MPTELEGLSPRASWRACRARPERSAHAVAVTGGPIDVTRADGVVTITLARPEALGALSMDLARAFVATVDAAEDDETVRCIVITGTGRAFSAGGDIREFAAAGERVAEHIAELAGTMHRAIERLAGSDKPVITAVNGVAAGGGLGLALAGDLVFAAESARFVMAYSRIAAAPDGGSSYFLARLVGLRRAMELYLTNRMLSAQEAREWGLVTRVVADADLGRVTAETARELAAGPTRAIGMAKRLFREASGDLLRSQLASEARAIVESSRTEDFREGIAAFLAKRAPSFRGR